MCLLWLLLLLSVLQTLVADGWKELLETGLEQLVNGSLVLDYEALLHEAILRILDQLSEGNHQAPWMWPMNLESFK